jgi:predicted TIM-barrel fold metal-dependent hydrolase
MGKESSNTPFRQDTESQTARSAVARDDRRAAPTRREFLKYGAGITAGTSLLTALESKGEADTEPEPVRVGCPIIDIHAHVGYPSRLAWIPDWITLDHESMKRHQRMADVAQSFISDSSLYPKEFFEDTLLELCRTDTSLKMWATYISWTGLYPGTKDRNALLETALKDDRVVGAKLDLISGVWGRASMEILNKYLGEEPAVTFDLVRDGDPVFEICAAAGKPLMCHADLSSSAHKAERIVEMANRHPNVTVIIAHIGLGLNFSHFAPKAHLDALLAARKAEQKNVYVDTSMFSLAYCGQIEELAEKLGSNRMLFGSDSPAKSAAAWVGRIRDAEMSEEHKENVFHRSAEELFSL